MPATTFSASIRGVDAELIRIEIQIVNGLPGTTIIGLPDSVVKESRDRVKAAIRNSGFPFPDRKILINLAPAHQRKEGPALDLAIAIGILCEQEVLPKTKIEGQLFLGELSLDGSLRPVCGLLSAGWLAKQEKFSRLIAPAASEAEMRWVEGFPCYALPDLKSVVAMLLGQGEWLPVKQKTSLATKTKIPEIDLSDVRGQHVAKRALLIAAAGGHNLLFMGPPGTGKTMLAKRFSDLIPELDAGEAFEVLRVQNVFHSRLDSELPSRPFRSPHHTITLAGLLGGGPNLRPGEISLAHRGVLFLDELPEFRRDLLEALRQPLEEGKIEIGRARYWISFPADFIFLAAMNPCPCGFLGHPTKACSCTLHQVHKYRSKISGPLLDRLDLHVEVPALENLEKENEARTSASGFSTAQARLLIQRARQLQKQRFEKQNFSSNSRIPPQRLKNYCSLDFVTQCYFQRVLQALSLSQRAHDRCLRVARTIADLAGEEKIQKAHISEAISYRSLDRQGAGLVI